MFTQMPQPLRDKVLKFLEDNDFPAAKELYDDWHSDQSYPKIPDEQDANIFLPIH